MNLRCTVRGKAERFI